MFFKDLKMSHKPKKIWADKGSQFYNRRMKSCLQDNDIENDSTHNEWKSVVAERFIRTWKNKIYKYMTSVSKNVHINELDNMSINLIIHILEKLKSSLLM